MPELTLFLSGDVMTGCGVEQVLEHPADSVLYERWAKSALDYVALAEAANGICRVGSANRRPSA